ncbi:hyaluronidase-5-like [Salmo trutta]|uniref:hyaluronidase-5-like n=1 Tax=Salmo trutta TaxID=8032 RepID=UPI0011321CE4|nr:hyaluronidase-5-like [Salmo trutta]
MTGDLVSTIGESAAVGASGAMLWGASANYDDKRHPVRLTRRTSALHINMKRYHFLQLSLSQRVSCEALSSYLTTTLNPYVNNVTATAQLCTNFLCQGNGRCVRKHYESDHYLHLSSGNFRILWARGTYMVLGTPSLAYLTLFSRRFTCQCYAEWTCSPKLPIHLSKALVFRLKHQGH